jgi:hypothetical protein
MSIETVARNEVCVYSQGEDVKGKPAAFHVMQGHGGGGGQMYSSAHS